MQGTYQGQKSFGKMFSITVDGNYYGTGPVNVEQKYGLSAGDTIEFETEQRGKYTNADPSTIKKVSGGSPQAASAGAVTKNDYWAKKEEGDKLRQLIIEHQSSRNAAIHMVDVLLKNAAIAVPAKKAAQYDFCIALVDKITAKFNDDLEMVKQFETLPTNSSQEESTEVEDELE